LVRASPDADQPDRQRSTSSACQTARAIIPSAMIQSRGFPTGDSATVDRAPDWSADSLLVPQASWRASHATRRCTTP
jgi:hypothetical protein